jgi:hypothetical protein
MLGGENGRTLFITAAEWRGMRTYDQRPGWTGQLLAAPGSPRLMPDARDQRIRAAIHG